MKRASHFDLNFFFSLSILCECRIFGSVEGQQAIKMKDDLMRLIKQMEIDILTQWSKEATDIIHASTSKYLLIKREKGLIATNFDESVSAFYQSKETLAVY